MSEIPCGSVHRTPVAAIADKCARTIMGYLSPRAVTLDLQGKVWVETPETAPESELVGVYRYDGLLGLTRMILDDLQQEVETRVLSPTERRYTVGPEGAAQRARARQ